MDEILKKLDELNRAHVEYKKVNDERLALVEKKSHVPSDKLEKLDKLDKSMDDLHEQIEKLQAAHNRSGSVDGKEMAEMRKSLAAKAAKEWMRKGRVSDAKALEALGAEYISVDGYNVSEDEKKSLSVGNQPDGGYTVRPEVSSRIVSKVFESSPVRQLADVVTITSDALEMLADYDEPSSGWVGEMGSRAETDTNQLSLIRIPTHELYANPKASQKILDDSGIDIEAWHAGKVAAKFARDEATAFVSGTGVAQPRGILTYSSGTGFGQVEQVASGTSGAFEADGLISLQNALKEEYQGNASWLLKRASLGLIRKLKDQNDQYLLATVDGLLKTGAVTMLLGKPVYMANDVPVASASSLSAIYGDFKQGYTVVDRIGMRVLRDPYTSKGFVHFYTTKRVGGDVANFEALKIQVLST